MKERKGNFISDAFKLEPEQSANMSKCAEENQKHATKKEKKPITCKLKMCMQPTAAVDTHPSGKNARPDK